MIPICKIRQQADTWAAFAKGRCRFNVERKAAESVAFSTQQRAKSFSVPSKLVGTREFQNCLDTLRLHNPVYDELQLLREDGELLLSWQGFILGRIQRKHYGWIRPLAATGRLKFYLLQVTGGEAGKPTLGCNFAIAGISEAIEAQRHGYGFRIRPHQGVPASMPLVVYAN